MCRTEGHPAMKRAAFVCCVLFGLMVVFGIPSADAQGLEQDGKAMSSAAHLELAEGRPAPTSFKVVTAGYLGLSAGDFYLSNRCIQAGRCVEVGAYRGVAMHPLAFGLTKMAASSALAATAWSIRKHHPKAGWWLLAGLTVAQSAVVYWNVQQGHVR
jgi:hypothetical protein